jgi:ABC-type bacteriocin/lantibiotic exporter with double-glycine peptidase domain
MVALAGLLITLPAIVVAVIGLLRGSTWMMVAALASFSVNILPFVVGMFLVRNQEHSDEDGGHH